MDPEKDGLGEVLRCCWCGYVHASGIFMRETPESADLMCRALSGLVGSAHKEDEEDES
jgi:hypothetical protein